MRDSLGGGEERDEGQGPVRGIVLGDWRDEGQRPVSEG